ncbi:MAG: trypsin-like peptidase domain-containing protein [Verrucomicrobia bacterium]|nr:trypsin-like peptidase domain-containing protein [Verrucomicrobiota bacterium]
MKNRESSLGRTALFRNATTLLLALFSAAAPGHAVVFHSTNDLTYNTTAPTGALANSGWQYEGSWSNFLGTAIAPSFFITAQHVGGNIGEPFTLNGTTYTTTAVYNDPGTDLAIWKVNATFSAWASLYTASSEVGSSLVVCGKGLGRGAEVWADGELKGWKWSGNLTNRWGENVVTGTTNYAGSTLLYARFDAGAGTNEATLAGGDSGGGVFIQQNSTWRLAGVNYAVDGPFNTNDTGGGFNAAIFDEGGLYYKDGSSWIYVTNQTDNIPTSFYATSISARQSWINSIIIPEPATSLLTAVGTSGLFLTVRRRARRPSAAHSNPETH